MEEAIRILVVDDSALYRQLVRNVLREVPGVEVVGAAKGGRRRSSWSSNSTPNCSRWMCTCPIWTASRCLRELKRRRSRTRAVMLSSLTADGAQVTTDALLEGAFDFIHKPSGNDVARNRETLLAALIEKVEAFRSSPSSRSRRRARRRTPAAFG